MEQESRDLLDGRECTSILLIEEHIKYRSGGTDPENGTRKNGRALDVPVRKQERIFRSCATQEKFWQMVDGRTCLVKENERPGQQLKRQQDDESGEVSTNTDPRGETDADRY